MGPDRFTDISDWGILVAILLVFVGVSNLLALYTIARFYNRRERRRREDQAERDPRKP